MGRSRAPAATAQARNRDNVVLTYSAADGTRAAAQLRVIAMGPARNLLQGGVNVSPCIIIGKPRRDHVLPREALAASSEKNLFRFVVDPQQPFKRRGRHF
jgi:hypothetical protein